MSWQPIETAPCDAVIILYRPSVSPWWRVSPGKFDDDKYARNPRPFWRCRVEGVVKTDSRNHPPTHWQPLPTPPAPETDA